MPSFTLPSDLTAGEYRLRFNVAWNSIEACGYTAMGSEGGAMVDITLVVESTVVPSYEVTVSVNDNTMGTAKKVAGENDEFTLTATAKEGYEFVNWTVAGAEVSAENPYVFTATENAEVVANFQVVAQWPATMALIETAKELIVKDGVGYPSATAKATFKEALDAAEANTTIASIAPLQAAIDAYVATTEIVTPVTGKTYAFVVARSESDLMYIYNNEGTLALAAYDGTSALPESAYFTAGTSNDKLTFQSVADNKYMAIPQPAASWLTNNSVSGLESEVTLVSEFEVLKLQSGMNDYVQASEEQLFGMVYLFGSRGNRTDNGNSEPGVIIVNSANGFDKSNNPMCGYNGTNFFTSAIRVVEVDYNTTPVYTVTVNAGVGGTAEASATEAEEGTEVTFTATAEEGYAFVCWTAGTDTVSVENPYTTVVNANVELTANFELLPVKYTVTVNAGVGGTAEASATEVEEGTEVTLTATAAEGYAFAGWTTPETTPLYYIQNYNTKKYLGYNSSNLAAIDEQTSDVTIAPSTMNEGEFTIFLTNATYDQQTPPQAQSYMHCGSSGRFSGNSVNTSASQQIAVFKVEDPAAETITATQVTEITSGATYMFVGLKSGVYYALTDELYKEGTTDQRMVGAEVTITDGTISFVSGTSSALWTITNKAFESTENPYTVTVTANAEFTANFVEVPVVKYAVSVTTVDATMGTAEVSATEVKDGEEATFTATANLGYKFVGWLSNGETVSTENPYTTAVTAEMALVANFEALTPAIVLTATPDVERQFSLEVAAEAKILIDWGNGELKETETIGETYPGTSWIGYYATTVNGTPVGEGVVKIYGDITYFDCSYSSAYPSKVTTLDVTNATSLLEVNISSNEIATLDLSNNTALYSLTTDNNATLTTLVLPETNQLNILSAQNCSLSSLDLSSCASLTSLNLNENSSLGAIDVTSLTALKTFNANNTGLTTIDLSASSKITTLRLNNNQLTSLDISGCAANVYVWADNNKLTELVVSEGMKNTAKVSILNNNFTLATLPALSVLTDAKYIYAPQAAMTIAAEITEGEELDLSAQTNIVGRATEAQATDYTWYTAEGEEFTSYTEENGKFVFDVEADTELYCTMTTAAFPSFSGANVFKTTNIVVKNFEPAIVLTATPDVERQFSLEVAAEAKILIDWGNGELKETETIGETYPGTSWIGYYATTVNGTPVGEGVVKIYGDITYFDCSYSSAYPSKVTTLDVTNATSLLEVNISSNEIATLDLSNNTALYSLTTDNNATLTTLVLPETNQLNILSAQNCSLSSLDLSSCASLTSLNLNENSSLGAIDVTSLTALKTFNANNTGLTTIDLSASSKITTLRLNNNQLTSLDISGCAANVYVWADNNKLTELVVSEGMKNTAKVSILNNNFTLATLPALSVLTDAKYIYAPQAAMTIAAEITEGEELDLSAQTNIVGRATEAQATDYTWYTAEGEEFTSYTEENGKFVFDVDADTELYCAMTTAAFPSFSGANAFKTTNIVVKNIPADENTLALIESAKVLIEKEGLGYPSATAKATFQEAIDAAEANPTAAAAAPLQAAMNEYYATSDIVRPEADKVYAFISKGMYYNYYVYNNAGTLALASYTAGAELPDAAKFVCEFDAEAGKYLFKTVDGMYYMAYPSPGKGWLNDKSETGLETTARKVCQFDIDKITIDANVSATVQDLFGYVHLWGYRGNETKNGVTSDFNGPMIVKSTGAWDGAGGDYYNASTSSAFSIVEVEYVAPVVTYTVTVANASGASATNGTVAIEGFEGTSATVEEGTEVTIVATPAEGYQFISWADAMNTDVSTEATYTFTVNGNVYLEAWFEAIPVTTYTVAVVAAPTADYGTVAINGVEGTTATVAEGTEVTVVATPAEGYVFEGWYSEMGEELSIEATYTFTVTADATVQGWFADAPVVEPEYCTYEGNSQHNERRLNALTITDGTNTTTVSSIQPNFRGAVYVDKTDVEFPTYAGATVDFSEFDFKGEWMHAYVYVDYNNDGTFDTTVNADGTTGGELVSFTFYSATDSKTGVNSLGETVSEYTIPMVDYLPAFTLPADIEEGTYRVRVKIDWNHLDPCGHPSESENKLTTNGGCIADFTMTISEADGVEFTESEVAQVYAADGVIYINGYEGNVKVVNVAGQVVKDVNVNGNDTLEVAAGLYIVVTGDQVTKVVVK